VTPTQKKSDQRSTGSASKSTRKKSTTGQKKKDYSKKKDVLFIATCIIEAAHLIATKLGRELEPYGFKITYEKLKEVYKELK
tara:strand:- start:298 stop:543 length:246 start_codon:yes stop_codon:yes gene_type:complete